MTAVACQTPSHLFLANPAVQYIYGYLTELVVECSQNHFKKKPADLRILDWGCGKGHITLLLRKYGVEPVSCDLVTEKEDSSFGQSTPFVRQFGINVIPLQADVTLPFADQSFDAVISMGVLEHVSNDVASLREIHRILRKGGLFFCFFLPAALSWTQRLAHLRGDYYHERFYSKREIIPMLQRQNFELLDLWQRQLFPKNGVRYWLPGLWERLDQFLTEVTPLGWFATNVEFIARKAEPTSL